MVQRAEIQRVTGRVPECSPLSRRRGVAWEASAAERSGLEQHAWGGAGGRGLCTQAGKHTEAPFSASYSKMISESQKDCETSPESSPYPPPSSQPVTTCHPGLTRGHQAADPGLLPCSRRRTPAGPHSARMWGHPHTPIWGCSPAFRDCALCRVLGRYFRGCLSPLCESVGSPPHTHLGLFPSLS